MRHLIACSNCKRQYDASGRSPDTRLHCSCGNVMRVERAQSHESAVVRCSACGAPREGQALDCTFCGASFTLVERDLNTMCPNCMTRVGDKARFCHHCATPIVPQEEAGGESENACPVCGDEQRLYSRQLGELQLSVLECGRCAGLWLGSDVFRRLETGAKTRSLPVETAGASPSVPPPPGTTQQPTQQGGALYRPCVVCSKLMVRQNYGRRSGVIIDLCKDHGIWFDHHELSRILGWIREGGFDHSKERDAEEEKQQQREKERKLRTTYAAEYGGTWGHRSEYEGRDFLSDVGSLLGNLFR